MSVPPPEVERKKIHTRKITVEGYQRSDGLWDIEARLTDVKTIDYTDNMERLPAGQPMHDMWLRITIDQSLTIRAALAKSLAVPYPGTCERIAPDYSQLQGLQIQAGFRRKVMALFNGVQGCTHITELIFSAATGAFQTLAEQAVMPENEKPFPLDGCHALDSKGPVVAKYYPKWYKKPQTL